MDPAIGCQPEAGVFGLLCGAFGAVAAAEFLDLVIARRPFALVSAGGGGGRNCDALVKANGLTAGHCGVAVGAVGT